MATHGIEMYLWKDKKRATRDKTATNATFKQLTRVKGHDHKLYIDNYFSSPELTEQKMNCCGTVRPNRKGKTDNFKSRTQTEKHEC